MNKLAKKIKKIRHRLYAMLSGGLLLSQILMGVTFYSGPGINSETEEQMATNIILKTNEARSNVLLTPLVENEILNQAAKLKLNDMFTGDYWEHVSPTGTEAWDFMKQTGYIYQFAGENLAKGYYDSSSAVNAWMNSKTHKDNILNTNFSEIGIAVGSGKINGKSATLIVQLFGKPKTSNLVEATTDSTVLGVKQNVGLDLFAPVSNNRIPYFLAWIILFALIIFDGIELRKLGLHKSKKHMFEFRSALLINTLAFIILFINFSAVL